MTVTTGLMGLGGVVMRVAVVAAVVCLSVFNLSAVSAQAAIRQTTNIAPQGLGPALQALAKERSFQLVYRSELVDSLHTQGAVGDLTSDEALTQLLSGTGLTFRYLDEKTITVFPAALSSSLTRRADEPPVRAEERRGIGRNGTFVLAQADPEQDISEINPSRSEADSELGEVVVTGSRLRSRAVEGPRQLKIYGRKEIEASGQATITDFLNTRSEVSTAIGENPNQLGFGQTSVQLRGLPVGSTLVLLNGRRVQSTAPSFGFGGFFDLNMIPAAAVERIEVLPDSASAIYGSDALAGVVNVILRKSPSGFDLEGRYGHASGLDEASTSLAWGHTWRRGSVSVVGSYFNRNELSGTERAITANKDFRRFGGPDQRTLLCDPGTVSSAAAGANLPGLSSSEAGIPAGITGAPTINDFVATAGQPNRCDRAASALIPETERSGVYLSADYDLTSSLHAFAELLYSRVEQLSLGSGQSVSNVLLPASNAFNPFGVNVRVSRILSEPFLRVGNTFDMEFTRPLLGLRGEIASTWRWEVAAWESKDEDDNDGQIAVSTANLSSALASNDPSTALNLFASTPGSSELLQSIYNHFEQSYMGKLRTASAHAAGELFDLPAGAVETVIGAEYSDEKLSGVNFGAPFDFQRHSRAAFAELRAPIVAGPSDVGDALVLSAAGRYDEYDDFGARTSPQFGLEWRPSPTLLFRAGYAEAFRSPGLFQLYGPRTPLDQIVTDPRRGGETRVVPNIQGGNPDLQPESGESTSVGVVYSSRAFENLRLALTAWRVKQEDRVTPLLAQAIINNEQRFPGRVLRGPDEPDGSPGPILQVDRSSINFGLFEVSGADLEATYQWDSAWGKWTPTLSVTYTDRYRVQLTPETPVTDQAGHASVNGWAPRVKGLAGMAWSHGPYAASVNGRYVSDYTDYQDFNTNTNELGDFWLFDVNANVDIGRALSLGDGFPDIELSLGLINALDSEPEYANYLFSRLGYDPTQYDLRGQFAYVNLTVGW